MFSDTLQTATSVGHTHKRLCTVPHESDTIRALLETTPIQCVCRHRMASYWKWCRAGLVITDVSEENVASIFRVERISELGICTKIDLHVGLLETDNP
jgi:hypothetical protein